jgi:hypothetical protein
MIPPFDLFRIDPLGSPVWVEAVETVQDGKALAEALGVKQPGVYWIVSAQTGNKVIVTVRGKSKPSESE